MEEEKSRILLFYRKKIKANNKDDYYFDDILNWSDYKLEVEHDYISWLFPDKTGGVNNLAPKLKDYELEYFKQYKDLRKNVIRASMRMLNFYGFEIYNRKLIQIKSLDRFEFNKNKKTQVGFYKIHNFRRLTRIMNFLYSINMKSLSSYYFLMICRVLKKDKSVLKNVLEVDSLPYFLESQKYLSNIDSKKIINKFKQYYNSEVFNKLIYGLNYTNNSCYQDSSLVCLLSRENNFINSNILYKNFRDIPEVKNKICNDKVRKSIQKELILISESMKGNNDIKYCIDLRKIISKCYKFTKFSESDMQDAGEFLQFLFEIFNVENVKIKTINYVTNSKEEITIENFLEKKDNLIKTSNRIEYFSPVFNISNFVLRDNFSFNEILTTFEDVKLSKDNRYNFENVKYSRKITLTKILETNYIIFNLMRTFFDITKNKIIRKYDFIDYEEYLEIGNNKLKLDSIIIHERKHYTAYININNFWYFYNDNPSGNSFILKKIGTFRELTDIKDTHTLGTLYFYV